ncbi:MAG: hypothetical protein JSU70_13015 [Phycisphaerales bacterium]|nr:MAG: hypothetical protein JSU70_13015 [Phycisphaerales bacterium]
MNPEQSSNISVIDPISPAINRTRAILFEPFELKKWFIIGFCAWLAYFGSGSGGPNFGGGGPQHDGFHHGDNLEQVKDFVISYLPWIILVAVIVVAFIIALVLVVTWLSSRGRFMFLHCVAENKAEVKIPWSRYRQHGNSLFAFRIVLSLIGFGIFAVFAVITVLLVVCLAQGGFNIFAVLGLVANVLLFIALVIALSLVGKFTMDFVVPVMFLGAASCVAGWRQFMTVLSVNKARLLLYILFQIVIAVAISAIVVAAVCITCCCAACILAIPYIGTVLTLPLLVFKRSYSLYYLRQFGPDFDVFSPEVVEETGLLEES